MITSPAALWETLSGERDQQLDRARECAARTIPSLFPYSEGLGGGQLPVPFQSAGAEGVRNLASQLVLTLLPVDFPFFRFEPNVDTGTLNAAAKLKVDSLMSELEQAVQRKLEGMRFRTKAYEAFEYVLCGGSAVIDFRTKQGGNLKPRIHRFHNYGMRRDGRGNIALLVIRERPSVEELYSIFKAKGTDEMLGMLDAELGQTSEHAHAALYTILERTSDGAYESYQYVTGSKTERERGPGAVLVPGTKVTYGDKTPVPWIVLGYKWLDQESYPRSFCDELIGDLDYLNELSRSFMEASAIAARTNMMVDPMGLTEIDDLIDAVNGEPVPGREQDVHQLANTAQLAFLQAMGAEIAQRKADLQRQFLMFLGARREGERVTAVEVQQTALELEKGLGGFYSQLAEQLQKPLISIVLAELRSDPDLRSLRDEMNALGLTVTPKVTAGLEILSRGQTLNRFIAGTQAAISILGPEAVAPYLKVGEVLDFVLTQIGLPRPDFIRSEEEVQQLQAQAAQQQAVTAAAPQIAKGAIEQGIQ